MRFLLGVLIGYSIRGNQKRLVTFLTTLAFIVYIILPTVALLETSIRRLRPASPPQPVG